MQVFEESLDPSETKDFVFDWSDQLGTDETVVSHTVTFIDAAGTTSPSNSVVSPLSRVWLSGGVHGGKVIFTIRAVTAGGRTLEAALAVNVIDSLIGPAPASYLERLETHREKLLDAKDEAVSGNPVEVWNGRYGNKMKYQTMTYDQICTALERVEREIGAEQARLAGRPRRAPVSLVWTL